MLPLHLVVVGSPFPSPWPRIRTAQPSLVRALEELVVDDDATNVFPLTYAAATPGKDQATLTVRERYEDSPVAVPADNWEYTDDTLTAIHLVPDGTTFQRGTLYEFVYTARDPLVAGLGFAGVRDLAAYLRHAAADQQGNRNPLAGDIQYVYTGCVSQPCRTTHDFIRLGFNQDAAGGRVVDGMLNWIGGADGIFMNYRFAQPGRTQRQHIARWYPEFQFPFANQVLTDRNRQDRWAIGTLHANQYLPRYIRSQLRKRVLVQGWCDAPGGLARE